MSTGAASAVLLPFTFRPGRSNRSGNHRREASTRSIARVVSAQATSDGAGVRLNRVIATRQLPQLDPFLLLDAFESDRSEDYMAGFPMHPHRGFETVTYMIHGKMHHRDSLGNSGTIGPGDVQWMTAGRGIVHEEMPAQEQGLMFGFQLWVNLPRDRKMTAPRYQNIRSDRIPTIETEGGARVRVVAGTVTGIAGPVEGIPTNPLYLDVSVPPNSWFEQAIPSEDAVAAYAFEGEGTFGNNAGKPLASKELAVFTEGDRVTARSGASPFRFLLLAGRPLKEPIARSGPFVMNTPEELEQAYIDYRNGSLGRE